MESNAAVALARATVDGQAFFGKTSTAGHCSPLCRIPGRTWAPDEKPGTPFVELPQARQTYTVLGCQPEGTWGYEHGVNEHQVAVGCLGLKPTLTSDGPALLGTDLARLALERSRTARQAADLLTSFVERYGQGAFPGCPVTAERDNAFLVVDPTEAYAVETAGHHWVYQEVQEVRAVSNVRVIRQDWDRISQGLAAYAIAQGWWPDDGSKLDFAGALREDPGAHGSALRRWGRATLRLMEQSGHIDTAFVRQLLGELVEESLAGSETAARAEGGVTGYRTRPERATQAGAPSGFVVSLSSQPGRLATTWYAVAVTRATIYLPLFLDGDLPEVLTRARQHASTAAFWRHLSQLDEQLERDPDQHRLVRERFAGLQDRFDQEAEEFAAEGAGLKQRGAHEDVHRQATSFMQYNVERFEAVLADSLRTRSLVAANS